MACVGLLDDAAPLFRPGTAIAGAGVLLAMPALVASGVIECAREVYGSIGPAFFGLRTTIVALVLMALLRIKRPEALKEQSPDTLGRILGLDRAPEVKTLRRKLKRLAGLGRSTRFGRALAERRVAARGALMGFLYVDGHVRVFHGKATLPKTHVAQMRLSMPATTDYWVNDAIGEPLFVVTAEANAGLVKMLPSILGEAQALLGKRRLTVVFDRGGWSPKLFAKLVAAGFDLLTYRKGRSRRLPRSRFREHKGMINGRTIEYTRRTKGCICWAESCACARSRDFRRMVTRRPSSRAGAIFRPLKSRTACSSAGGRRTSSSTCARSMRSTPSSSMPRNRMTPRARSPIQSGTC